MTGYELSKAWFKWCKVNRPLINPNHHALYFWIIEKANSLEWCPSFGLPSEDAMHHLGISSYKTYIKAFDDLEKFGFIKVIERSKNQYTCNIVALVIFTEAHDKASPKQVQSKSKALTKASPKQSDYNKTFKLLNFKTLKPLNKKEKSEFSENENPLPPQSEIIVSEIENIPPKKEKKEKAPQDGGASEKKVWGEWKDGQGDGELHELLKDYFLNPNSPRYEAEEYRKFKAYWTAKVLVGTGKGKELWRTKQTFSISGRLSTWNGKATTFNQNKNHGTTSQLPNSRSKNNWNAEQVALDAIAIATAHLN